MTASTELGELIVRVEAATGPDREIDARLWCLGEGVQFSHLSSQHEAIIFFRPGAKGSSREDGWTPYTASLGAALALVERVLPGGWPGLQRNRYVEPERAWSAWLDVFPDGAKDYDQHEGEAKTAALALLSALLKALQASRGGSSPLRATKSDRGEGH